MCVCSCYAEQVAGSIWPGLPPSIPLNILAAWLQQHTHAHTSGGKKSLKNQPLAEERPTEAVGEEKSANPPIRSAERNITHQF